MADLTPAEELRAAATRLRAAPTDPARLDDTIRIGDTPIGTCHDCGVIPEFDAPLDELLVGLLNAREPLAALFDDLADEAEATYATEVHLGPDTTYATGVVDYRGELCSDLTHALATARTVLGAAEQPGGEPAPAEQPVAAATLRPDMVVSHPTWLNGGPVRIVTARVGAGVVAIRYRDVRAHHADVQVKVPLDFAVTPGCGFVDGAR